MSALEHRAQGRVLWLEANTHDNVSISIVNVHQATSKRHDLQRQVTLLLRAMIDTALTQRRIMGGDFNAALSRYGYAQSASALYDKVDNFFQDFVHSTHGTLIESEAHTRRDLFRGSSRAFWQKSGNDRAFFLVACVKKSRAARFGNSASTAKI